MAEPRLGDDRNPLQIWRVLRNLRWASLPDDGLFSSPVDIANGYWCVAEESWKHAAMRVLRLVDRLTIDQTNEANRTETPKSEVFPSASVVVATIRKLVPKSNSETSMETCLCTRKSDSVIKSPVKDRNKTIAVPFWNPLAILDHV